MTLRLAVITVTLALIWQPLTAGGTDQGLVTKRSNHSVPVTVERFENAIKAKGFMVFSEVDSAGAATKFGLDLRPRTLRVACQLPAAQVRGAPAHSVRLEPTVQRRTY